MSLSRPRTAWATIVVLVLLAISVRAHPIRESSTETAAQPASNVQPRDPRLIPDTEHYLADVFGLFGVPDPTPSSQPTPSFNAYVKAEHGKPENIKATPVVSSSTTATTHPAAAFTTVIRHGDKRPIENIQIGTGWSGKKKITAEDLPFIFDAVYKVLAHRFRNMIDSSDERGLEDDSELLDWWR